MAVEPEGLTAVPPGQPEGTRPRSLPWHSKLVHLCFVIFCFEVGVFLLVFPWLRDWGTNAVAQWAPWLSDIWENPYFRGALSGLGLINIYISFLEVIRLLHVSASSQER